MKCHYENIKGVGKVLIPGCDAVAISGDIQDCICRREPQTFVAFERQEYNKEIKRLKAKIKELEDEKLYINVQYFGRKLDKKSIYLYIKCTFNME